MDAGQVGSIERGRNGGGIGRRACGDIIRVEVRTREERGQREAIWLRRGQGGEWRAVSDRRESQHEFEDLRGVDRLASSEVLIFSAKREKWLETQLSTVRSRSVQGFTQSHFA